MMQDYEHALSLIKDLLKKNPGGMSVTDISNALNKNKNTIGRYLDILLISGHVDMRTYGMAKVFTLSQRVPLSAMLSYSKELIMVLDKESRIIDVNDNFLMLLGLSRKDTLGKNITYLSPPAVDVHELLETISAGFKDSENPITFEIKDKGERIFKQKCIPTVFDDGGKGVTIILEDITSHVIAQRQIKEREERFRMMAENIQDGLIIMENGKNVYVNNRISEITGYSFEELWKMNPVLIVAPEDRKKVEMVFQKSGMPPLSGSRDILVWIMRKDKKRRFVYGRSTILQSGKNTYEFFILTDITELKSKETALMESEQRFRTMAENIQDGLIIIEAGTIVFTNRRISEITGYSLEEMMQMGFSDLVSWEKIVAGDAEDTLHPTKREKIQEIIKNTRPDSPVPGEFKLSIQRKDGRKRFIHGKVTAAEQSGKVSTYITMTDITEFAEREQVLRDQIASLQQRMG